MILGLGIDIQEIGRVEKAIRRGGKHFLARTFTPSEIRYCRKSKKSAQHFAARFCAKEALLKALGTGWAKGIRWTDVAVAHGREGQPRLRLSGSARERCRKAGVKQAWISLSHSDGYAAATVILEG